MLIGIRKYKTQEVGQTVAQDGMKTNVGVIEKARDKSLKFDDGRQVRKADDVFITLGEARRFGYTQAVILSSLDQTAIDAN